MRVVAGSRRSLPILLAIVVAAGLVVVDWLDIVHRGVDVALGLVFWLAHSKVGLAVIARATWRNILESSNTGADAGTASIQRATDS